MHSVILSVARVLQPWLQPAKLGKEFFVTAQHAMMLGHGFKYVLLALDTACLAVADNLRQCRWHVFW